MACEIRLRRWFIVALGSGMVKLWHKPNVPAISYCVNDLEPVGRIATDNRSGRAT